MDEIPRLNLLDMKKLIRRQNSQVQNVTTQKILSHVSRFTSPSRTTKGNSFNTDDVTFKSYLKWKSYVKN